ncbi:hypothetical protein [Rhodococcus sp. ACT016]|uniref:hypothetical protein n=1 Tax=Rhodococcus sp. ACT016 TaxID=3134808 RepID=UPI003D29CED5
MIGLGVEMVCVVDVVSRSTVWLSRVQLLNDPSFRVEGNGAVDSAGLLGRALAAMSSDNAAIVSFWAGHLAEIESGIHPGHPTTINRDYSAGVSMRYRIRAKCRELATLTLPGGGGAQVSERTLARRLRAFRAADFGGLIDRRHVRISDPSGVQDEELCAVVDELMDRYRAESSVTQRVFIERVKARFRESHPEYDFDDEASPAFYRFPSERTFRRLFRRLDCGRHFLDTAKNRQSQANTPRSEHRPRFAGRPGGEVMVNWTRLDVLCSDRNGDQIRPFLTILMDKHTRTIMGSLITPQRINGFDATIMLADSLVPYHLVDGRIERFVTVNSMLPRRGMRSMSDRVAAAQTRPYIVPDTITIDNGLEFRSSNFAEACRAFGISVNWCSPRTAWEKGVVERQFRTINDQFAALFANYLGPNVTQRGTPAAIAPRVTLDTVRELFDEWVLHYWQNRPHDALHDPASPRRKLTPNQMYEASLVYSPVFALPITTEMLYRLYYVRWQKVEHYGVQVNSIRYDCAELNPLRYQASGVAAHNDRWEIRYNPHFPICAWVHDPHTDTWITAFAKRNREYDVPFADAMWSPPEGAELDEQIVRTREVVFDDIRRRAGRFAS